MLNQPMLNQPMLNQALLNHRKADERGHTDLGWLDSRHTFSFGDYVDRNHVRFGPLRVLNDDRVAPGAGFPTHPHRDREILTYVVEGALEHRDSMGNGSILTAGEFQLMSAGTGITHSECNPSANAGARFLQIWILPETLGLEPRYEQRPLPLSEHRGSWLQVATADSTDDAMTIHQNVHVYAGDFGPGSTASLPVPSGGSAWLQIVDGSLKAHGVQLAAGDGLGISATHEVTVEVPTDATTDATALLFLMEEGA